MLTIEGLIDDRPADGVFRVHRDVFTDEQIFVLEQQYIFEATWVFLGLESQAPHPHDFFTTFAGRYPLVVMRGGDGRLRCVINSCRHKGALLCRTQSGNKQVHTCPYHSWAYDSTGKNVGIKARAIGAYGAGFDDEDHNLRPVAHFESYRGFLFASINTDVPPLREHLGDSTTFIDLVIDQSPGGIETIPGDVSYVYDGNWKLQMENCGDGYHFTSAHASYLKLIEKRDAESQDPGQWRVGRLAPEQASLPDRSHGSFAFRGGHSVLWSEEREQRANSPLFASEAEITARVGAMRTRWMFGVRNLTIFPNMQLADNAAVQLRIIRPLAANKTEMRTFCVAPVGEPADARRRRIRQYEDFFNPSGLATPDDNVCYEDCQTGHGGGEWLQGYMRGLDILTHEPNRFAAELNITPVANVTAKWGMHDETLFAANYREWARLLRNGLEREPAGVA
jgi:benzoate/toluate 1,2-dioxygenase alpha subunit